MSASRRAPQPETIIVPADADEICCDGGSPVLGHPAVWYSFGSGNRVECGYCDRVFIKESQGLKDQ